MSKYAIATFIVCSAEGFVCYLIGYVVGIRHDKRTITHECVKDMHDKTEPTIVKKDDTFCGVPMAEAVEVMQRYKAEKTEPQTEEVDRIPYDPLVEMDIKRRVEERLRQTERSE